MWIALGFLWVALCWVARTIMGIAWPRTQRAAAEGQTVRVAVVGGGIAGCAAAWSLRRGGCEVHVYESRPVLGGNAKTYTWAPGITTGLSVLAWPDKYFKNYTQLLKALGVSSVDVSLPFFVQNHKGEVFAHGKPDTGLSVKHAKELARWAKMVARVRRVNNFFAPAHPDRPSFYTMSLLNPLNFIPLRWLAAAHGMGAEFWRDVVVPIYSSSFLTIHLNRLPAVILPTVDDLISPNRIPQMKTWEATSETVFQRLVEGVHVHTNCNIQRIQRTAANAYVVTDATGHSRTVDRLVFACSADAAAKLAPGLTVFESALLKAIAYTDDDDASFLEGTIHSDASVLPKEHASEMLKMYANYIRVSEAGECENTFILSSWVPVAQKLHDKPNMLVTYNQRTPIASPRGTVSNFRAHPHLNSFNLAIVFLMRLLQGRRGIYYCGSYATPGNGHDLSLLSGLIVAQAMGAEYPFAANPAALEDFQRLRKIMGL
jgi:predicted NAD/FAD-binding protein